MQDMRKGYMFTLDAVFAGILLVISIAIVLGQFPSPTSDFFTDNMASDVINVLSHTKMTDVCNIEAGCSCPNYPTFQQIACGGNIQNTDASILEIYSEVIRTGTVPSNVVEDSIHEIFVTKNVIDEVRFGFAVLYTSPTSTIPLELYNTETYIP